MYLGFGCLTSPLHVSMYIRVFQIQNFFKINNVQAPEHKLWLFGLQCQEPRVSKMSLRGPSRSLKFGKKRIFGQIIKVLQENWHGIHLVHKIIRPLVKKWAQSDQRFPNYGVFRYLCFLEKHTEKISNTWTVGTIELIFSPYVL